VSESDRQASVTVIRTGTAEEIARVKTRKPRQARVWAGAITGAVLKLIRPRRFERVSIIPYLALGWMILVGMKTGG
jgi:predicted membrane channel-forming protein YqfA (hemolysin III family)